MFSVTGKFSAIERKKNPLLLLTVDSRLFMFLHTFIIHLPDIF